VIYFNVPLRARSGKVLCVLIVARISKTTQDPRSLDEQVAICKQYITKVYAGPVKFVVIEGQGGGELLDRKELYDIEAMIEAGGLDVVIVEDLARLCRRNRAFDICELCEDRDTRLIAINDNLDTAGDWRLNGLITSFQNEQHNAKLSFRLQERLRERFKTGGALARLIYGHMLPAGGRTDADLQKDPAAQAVYDKWFLMLESGASFAEVADWLNATGAPTGPYCRSDKWDGRMVARVTFNPFLKGVREHNRRVCRRVNKTGRRRPVNADPDLLLERPCPHLAFIDPERYDRLIAKLRAKNAGYARGRRAKAADGRKGMSKKKTAWPGQHIACGVCGRAYYWGGHGVKEHMMCSGARDYRCWNGATFDGASAASRLKAAVLGAIQALPDFDDVFATAVRARVAARQSSRSSDLARVDKQLAGARTEAERVAEAIAKGGKMSVLVDKLHALTDRKADLQTERDGLLREPPESFEPPTMEAIRGEARTALEAVAAATPELGRLMRAVVPRLEVVPHRLCDGGGVVLRARLTVDLTPLTRLPDSGLDTVDLLRRELTVDLFKPPQRVVYRERVVAGRAAGQTERQVAADCKITVTAAQRASALDRMMREQGLADPYVPLTEPPADLKKMRRHRHPRYRFDPLPPDGQD